MKDRDYKAIWQELKVEMMKQLDIESERSKFKSDVEWEEIESDIEDNHYDAG